MKQFWKNKKFIFWWLLILWLFVIFFVGRKFNEETLQRHFIITADGVKHFRKWLDVSWWTKLVYKVSFEKYEEIYTDKAELAALKKHIETIILENIDNRISKLGVSDYKAYTQLLNDQKYIVVEIGGVANLDQAKEIIWKTVELEFRMPSTATPTEKSIIERKLKAATIKEEVMKNPELMEKLTANRWAENIFYNHFTGATIDQLPEIYQKNQRLLESVKIGEINPDIMDWVYTVVEQEWLSWKIEKTTLKWFTFFHVIDKKVQTRDSIAVADVVQVAEWLWLSYEQIFTKTIPEAKENAYTYVGNALMFNAWEIAKDTAAYHVHIVKIKKPVQLGVSGSTAAIDTANTATIAKVKSQITKTKEFDLENVQDVYNGWMAEADLLQTVSSFDANNKDIVQEYKQLNDTYIVYVSERKTKDEPLYAQVVINNINKTAFEWAIKQRVIYDIEDVFVQDRETWTLAVDTKENKVLNGAYFKYANTSSSQVGEPVVVINLDEKWTELFCNISEVSIGKQMAIFIGGKLLTAPTIQSKICWWSAQIDGSFTPQSAKELVDSLNEWALPAPLILMQEEKISPTLWVNALNGALVAALVGIILIFFMMRRMYGVKKATVSVVILVEHIVVLALFMKIADYALSLSWIAAVILSIGMAVDSTVLVFERMNEEMKWGKSVESAINAAHERSWLAVRDGNVSTWLIALLLFAMGSNVFKWFGAMLLVTTAITLFILFPLNKILLKLVYVKKENN